MKHFLASVLAFFICWQTGKAIAPQPQDSVGIAQINGNYFIIHEVENRQTLFALSKVYKVSIQEILEANTGMLPALQNGQLLYIPLKNVKPSPSTTFSSIENGKLIQGNSAPKEETKPVPAPKEEKEKIIPPKKNEKKDNKPAEKPQAKEDTPDADQPEPQDGDKFNWDLHYGEDDFYHQVKAGETLYRIATYYGISVSELMKLNDLETSVIEVGKNLLIRKGEKKEELPKATQKPKEEKKETKPIETKKQEVETPVEEQSNTSETKEVKETGFAMIIDENFPDKDKNIALHTTAKVGTIILVNNPANSKSVYVRVVGKLQTDDKAILLMISPEAAQTLGVKNNSRTKLSLSYAQ